MKKWIETEEDGKKIWTKFSNGKTLEIKQVGQDYLVYDTSKTPAKVIACEDNPSKAKTAGNVYLYKNKCKRPRWQTI
jgi:hypothetical protein